jgi:hypothetical protein
MSEQDQPSQRIRITEDDVSTPEVSRRVEEMAQAQKVALIRTVGDAPSRKSGTGAAILTLTIGGAVGGLLAFLAIKVMDAVLGDALAENAFLSNMSFTFLLAVFIGAGVSLADVVMNKSWAKLGSVAAIAVPAAVGAALVMGFIAHLFYSAGVEWLYTSVFEQMDSGQLTESQAESYVALRMHPIRGFAWMLVGVSAGVAAGAASRSWKRLGLAALGGAIGGFFGGFVFDFIATSDSTVNLAQVVGIVLLGTLIGLATALIEQAGKSRWIEIVSGGLAGKQFILFKQEVTLGAAPSADITLIKDAGILPVAAVLRVRGNTCQVEGLPGTSTLAVNGVPVQFSVLSDFDVVTIGSTQLRFREKNSDNRTPGALKN